VRRRRSRHAQTRTPAAGRCTPHNAARAMPRASRSGCRAVAQAGPESRDSPGRAQAPRAHTRRIGSAAGGRATLTRP
jgi:hypothetical protein